MKLTTLRIERLGIFTHMVDNLLAQGESATCARFHQQIIFQSFPKVLCERNTYGMLQLQK